MVSLLFIVLDNTYGRPFNLHGRIVQKREDLLKPY